jgi:hypothetical protein
VARVLADDTQRVLPLDDAAALAEALDGGSDFHFVVWFRGQKIAPENGRFPGAIKKMFATLAERLVVLATGRRE